MSAADVRARLRRLDPNKAFEKYTEQEVEILLTDVIEKMRLMVRQRPDDAVLASAAEAWELKLRRQFGRLE